MVCIASNGEADNAEEEDCGLPVEKESGMDIKPIYKSFANLFLL